MVGIFFGSAFSVSLLISLPAGFGLLLLFAMVRCPGSSKKSHFHRVILGFGPCPGFDAADLRADTIPAGFPPPPSGLKPRSVLCCPTENMKYGSQRKSRDPKGLQSRAIPSCYPPQHIPFSVSVI